MILKISLLFLSLVLLEGCKTTNKIHYIDINQKATYQYFNGQKKVLILSCVRCGCFINAMGSAYHKDKLFFDDINIFTDTTCTSLKFIKNHISQKKIDSISNEIYNITLLKKVYQNGEYIARIVETKESPRLLDICKEFFKD